MCLTFYAAEMARPKSHKFAIRTVGLTDEQAAALFYVFCSAARAAAGTENYETSCSVRLSVLNGEGVPQDLEGLAKCCPKGPGQGIGGGGLVTEDHDLHTMDAQTSPHGIVRDALALALLIRSRSQFIDLLGQVASASIADAERQQGFPDALAAARLDSAGEQAARHRGGAVRVD